ARARSRKLIAPASRRHSTARSRCSSERSGREGRTAITATEGVMMTSEALSVRRLPIRLEGDDRRVILRPFVMSHGRVRTLFERLDAMPEEAVATLLADVTASFADRHVKLAGSFAEHLKIGLELTGWNRPWPKP